MNADALMVGTPQQQATALIQLASMIEHGHARLIKGAVEYYQDRVQVELNIDFTWPVGPI